jgi:hypothetical protein
VAPLEDRAEARDHGTRESLSFKQLFNSCSTFGTPFARVECFQSLGRLEDVRALLPCTDHPGNDCSRADTLRRGEFVELADEAALFCRPASVL